MILLSLHGIYCPILSIAMVMGYNTLQLYRSGCFMEKVPNSVYIAALWTREIGCCLPCTVASLDSFTVPLLRVWALTVICLLTYTIFACNCFEMKPYAIVYISNINKMDVVVKIIYLNKQCLVLVSVCIWSTGGLCYCVASSRTWDNWPLWCQMQWSSAMWWLWCHQTGSLQPHWGRCWCQLQWVNTEDWLVKS